MAALRKGHVSNLEESLKADVEQKGGELTINSTGMALTVTANRETQKEIADKLRQLSVAKGLDFPKPKTKKSAQEEFIESALFKPADLEYDEIPFIEVMDEIRDLYQFGILLDQSARDDSLSEDEFITFSGRGISLEAGLQLMLREKNAGFVVKDDVLTIVSLDVIHSPTFFETATYDISLIVEHDVNAFMNSVSVPGHRY